MKSPVRLSMLKAEPPHELRLAHRVSISASQSSATVSLRTLQGSGLHAGQGKQQESPELVKHHVEHRLYPQSADVLDDDVLNIYMMMFWKTCLCFLWWRWWWLASVAGPASAAASGCAAALAAARLDRSRPMCQKSWFLAPCTKLLSG